MNYDNIKSVPLVSREDNLRYAGLENEVRNLRYYESVRSPKLFSQLSNKIVAISLSVAVATFGFGVTKYVSDVKQESNSEIVYVSGVPDEIDGNLDIKVFVQKNGEAYFEDANGNRTSKLNGISAESVAELTGYHSDFSSSKSK